MGIISSLGAIKEFFSDAMNIGLRTMNDEINQQAVAEGLITPREQMADEHYGAPAHCRAGFEKLYTDLTSPNNNGGPA